MYKRSLKGILILGVLLALMASLSSAATCPWLIRGELYTAQCGVIKEVPESKGLLANDPQAIEVLDPELITIDPKYGSIKVAANGSFIYSPSPNIRQGTYVWFKYNATNGRCKSLYPAIAKIQIRCTCRPNIPTIDPICLPTTLGEIRDILAEAGAGCYGCGDVSPIIDLSRIGVDKNGNPIAGTYSFCVKCPGCKEQCGQISLIDCANDHPVANDDTFNTIEDTPITDSVAGNDIPSKDGGNVWLKETDPEHGTVVLNQDGSFTYTPEEGYCGEDEFTYILKDVDGDYDTATVTINIECVNDIPVANDDSARICQDSTLCSSVADNDIPSKDGENTWSLLSNPAHGTAVVDSDGTYCYTPIEGWSGMDCFTYQLCDIDNDCSQGTVTITVVEKCNCDLISFSQDGCMYPDELEDLIKDVNIFVCAECDDTPEWSFPEWPVDQTTGFVMSGEYTFSVTCHAGGEELEDCDSTCEGVILCTCQHAVCPCEAYAEDIIVGCGVSKEDLSALVVADCQNKGDYVCDQTPVIDLSGVITDPSTGFVTGGSYTVDCSPSWVECPTAKGDVIVECNDIAHAPDICLPIVCVELSGKLSCRDYSLPLYSAGLKQMVTAAGGGCADELSEMSVVLPGNINWGVPGLYQYKVVCKDAKGLIIASDTGRLILDDDCGCGPCGCSGFC
ncbi:MAG: cadherin-like domain-containing protein [Methanothrix sp.]|uniref:cadherin-like domain-containing protein n=3 Tax=Methanothrix sp. TaxID=90426 RepID=UPI003BB80BD8